MADLWAEIDRNKRIREQDSILEGWLDPNRAPRPKEIDKARYQKVVETLGQEKVNELLAERRGIKRSANDLVIIPQTPGPWNNHGQDRARPQPSYAGDLKVNHPPKVSDDLDPIERMMLMGDIDITKDVKKQLDDRETEKKLNLKPLLALVDAYTGSNFAAGYEDPNVKEETKRLLRDKMEHTQKTDYMELLNKIEDRKLRAKSLQDKDEYYDTMARIREKDVARKSIPKPSKPTDHIKMKKDFGRRFKADLEEIAGGESTEALNIKVYNDALANAEKYGYDIDEAYSMVLDAYKQKAKK